MLLSLLMLPGGKGEGGRGGKEGEGEERKERGEKTVKSEAWGSGKRERSVGGRRQKTG